MKLLRFLLVVLTATAFSADLQRILSEAQTAMIRGDLETAEQNYRLAYQIDSHNVVAVAGLKQVALQKAKTGAGASTEKQFAQVILAQIQFKEATFAEALDSLKKKITDASGGKLTANFVVQPGVDGSAKITLNLANIPATEALRYLADLVAARVEYQKYAIVIRPASGAAPVTAPR